MQPTIDLAAVLSPKHIGGIQLFVSGDQSVSPLSSSPIWKLLVAWVWHTFYILYSMKLKIEWFQDSFISFIYSQKQNQKSAKYSS